MKRLIIGLLILLVIGLLMSCKSRKEDFQITTPNGPYEITDSVDLNNYYTNEDINDFKVDTMACHPSCCGDQWPYPFDGLTSDEIVQAIADQSKRTSDYVRTSYTCALGDGGVGCPCINKRAYTFISSRGNNNSTYKEYIEPTHILKHVNIPASVDEENLTPFEITDLPKSYYSEKKTLNDYGTMARDRVNINQVSPIPVYPSKDAQVAMISKY
jgi:hypothetical protein